MEALPALVQPSRSQQLADEITTLAAYISAATYRLLTLIAEFDDGKHWEKLGLCSCAHWLNFQCGIGMNAAREKLRVAHTLKELPQISAAFEKGELSYSKVRAMTRIADVHNEDYLMNIARHGTAYHVEKLVATYRRCKRQQDAANAHRQFEQRELSVRYDADGSVILRGRFPADVGAMILKALERAMDLQDGSAADSWERRPAANAANTEIYETDVSAETSPKPLIATRRADALAAISESFLSNELASSTTADRYQVVVHVSAETLRRPSTESSPQLPHTRELCCEQPSESHAPSWERLPAANEAPGVSAETSDCINADLSHLEDGPHVSAETSRRIACDCSTVRMLEDIGGEPLSIGRKSRVIPAALRRALRFRDKGCRFPGCTHQHDIDGHHIEHWADGGETSLDNLVQLCSYHHHLVHEGGFDCRRRPDGTVSFKAPDGRTLQNSCAPLSLDEEADLASWMDSRVFDLNIDADTSKPEWYAGDRMDWDLGVFHLFACGERAANGPLP